MSIRINVVQMQRRQQNHNKLQYAFKIIAIKFLLKTSWFKTFPKHGCW